MGPITWLDDHSLEFPPLEHAMTDPDGLLAIGGDLSPARLLQAYKHGVFPWFNDEQPILWWSPNPRAVLFPGQIHCSRSLRKTINRATHEIRWDSAFDEVIMHCANTPRHGQQGTWITREMINAYRQLFTLGYAHSIEVWRDATLVGGLYGISIGEVFFGESMFSLESNASKIALVALAERLQKWEFTLIDCQVGNAHLTTMGVRSIPRTTFANLLAQSVHIPPPKEWAVKPL